ncbi:MAG: hypothetical protein AAF823_08645 [Planctomycetota bacterium]
MSSLPNEATDSINWMTRSGFFTAADLCDIITEEVFEPGELDASAVIAAIDKAFAAWRSEQAAYPEVTDYNRLANAFKALNADGIIAMHKAGLTQSHGYSDFREALSEHATPDSVRGYCFYHSQDLERAFQGHGLYLAFGPKRQDDDQTVWSSVGQAAVATLTDAGLNPTWDGTPNQRIHLADFRWQRRG